MQSYFKNIKQCGLKFNGDTIIHAGENFYNLFHSSLWSDKKIFGGCTRFYIERTGTGTENEYEWNDVWRLYNTTITSHYYLGDHYDGEKSHVTSNYGDFNGIKFTPKDIDGYEWTHKYRIDNSAQVEETSDNIVYVKFNGVRNVAVEFIYKKKEANNGKKPGTKGKNADDRTKTGDGNKDAEQPPKNEVPGSLKEQLLQAGCDANVINAFENGDYTTFNNWFQTHADLITSNLTPAQGQVLCNELSKITGARYSITWPCEITYTTITTNIYHHYYCDRSSYDEASQKFIVKGAYDDWEIDGQSGRDPLYTYIWNKNTNEYFAGGFGADREIPMTKSGSYRAYTGVYGTSDCWYTEDFEVRLDDTKPVIDKVTPIAPTGNNAGVTLQIKVHDDGVGLKSVTVENTKDSSKKWTKYFNGEKSITVEQTVPETAKYKIIAEDLNGNTEETTETVEVDTTPPELEGNPTVEVKYNTRKTKVDGNNSAKIGDDIVITLKANEEIKSLGNPLQETANNGPFRIFNMKEPQYDINVNNGNVLTFNSANMELKFRITEDVLEELNLKGQEGSVGLQLYGLRDKYNNVADDSKLKFENIFYLDDKAPKLTNTTISAKDNKGYTDKDDQNYMIIASGNKYVIDMTFDEELNEAPQLRIGSYIITSKEKDSKDTVTYTAEIDCDELLQNSKTAGLILNSDVPVIITNIIDKAENKAEDVTINKDNKSTNGYSFNYGMVETEDYFIVGAEKTENATVGDINRDNIINNVDNVLLSLKLVDPNSGTDTEAEKTNYDLNKDGTVDSGDLLELQKILERQINFIYTGTTREFKVISKDNLENKKINEYEELNNKFNVEAYDASGNIIENGENAEIKIEDNTIKITLKNDTGIECPITLKVTPKDNTNNDERKIGYITLERNNGYNNTSRGYILIAGTNKGDEIKGDVNNDGYITPYDSILALRAGVNLETLTKEEQARADVDGDGKVDSADSLRILRIDQGVEDGQVVSKDISNTSCNTIKIGQEVNLDMAIKIPDGNKSHLKKYSELKKENYNVSIVWKQISNVSNALTISDNSDGTTKITVPQTTPAGTIVALEAVVTETYTNSETNETETETHTGLIYWKVVGETVLSVPNKEITINANENVDINVYANLDNAKIEYETVNDKLKIETRDFKTKMVCSEPGESLLVVKSDDKEEEIKVNVIQPIESIDVDKTEVTVRQGKEEELKVTVNPQDATEDVQVVSSDKNIATIGYDETTKSYKIKGINGGNATIDVYSPSNNEIKKTINVTVEKQDTPTITKIEVENKEDGKVYKEGDEIFIRVNFDGAVAGTAPNLKIKFGEHYANGKAEFVEGTNNNTTIRYKYTVVNGDNGVMQIEKLSGGLLTDSTNAVQAKTSKENDVLALLQEENPDKTFINDSIYETMEGVVVDTEREEVSIISAVSKDSNWLKNGDEIKVQIVSEEELQKAPTVYFNDIEAKVEGEGTNYFASLPVTDDFNDGVVEIKVESIFDKAGNLHEALTAGEYNIDEPIIIDNSAPIVESVHIQKDEGQSVKEGDTVDIVVKFKDSANVTKEYVSSTEVPTLNLKVGGKAAQGTLTSDYKVGEYVEQITYTYTVAKGETGEITIAGMSGKVTDVAGNIKDLSKEKITNAKEEPIKTVNQPVATTTIKSPKTGDNVVIYVGIVLLITGIAIFVVELIYRKNKGNGRNK